MPRIFPMEKAVENRVMQITKVRERICFSVSMTKNLPNLHAIDTNQCFLKYIYENVKSKKNNHQSYLFIHSTKKQKYQFTGM
ncbi:hypothetical protein ABID39_000248 [Bartonella japonica]|uniref:Type ISP restriction-modification enzyme LLaBIII C-terminal specificity domain-containing protein n=1 Tax=Bartonella japonica TaxID=357761 RepID=A0ABV2FM56_9HYPH